MEENDFPEYVFCPVLKRVAEFNGECFDIAKSAEKISPELTAPEEALKVKNFDEICINCIVHLWADEAYVPQEITDEIKKSAKMFEGILEKLGFNPLIREECPKPVVKPYEDDTYVSPYRKLTVEEDIFLFDLKYHKKLK